MTTKYLCWVDDIEGFVTSFNGSIELLENDHKIKFVVDEHLSAKDFDTIAQAIDDDLIFLIDYNLKGNDGTGLDGDQVIKLIRKQNEKCIIVFYSSKATQEELRKLVEGLVDIICVIRESLNDILSEIADGSITERLKK